MRTSHLAEQCSTNFGIPLASRVCVVVLLLSLATVQAHAVSAGISITAPTRNDLIKITAALGNAHQGQAFHGTITATGKSRFYTYSISAGALPTGLTINRTTGVISGIPTSAGTAILRFVHCLRMAYTLTPWVWY